MKRGDKNKDSRVDPNLESILDSDVDANQIDRLVEELFNHELDSQAEVELTRHLKHDDRKRRDVLRMLRVLTALRQTPDKPDLTDAILSQMEVQRGFASPRLRFLVKSGRAVAALMILVVLLGVAVVQRVAPGAGLVGRGDQPLSEFVQTVSSESARGAEKVAERFEEFNGQVAMQIEVLAERCKAQADQGDVLNLVKNQADYNAMHLASFAGGYASIFGQPRALTRAGEAADHRTQVAFLSRSPGYARAQSVKLRAGSFSGSAYESDVEYVRGVSDFVYRDFANNPWRLRTARQERTVYRVRLHVRLGLEKEGDGGGVDDHDLP